ncbi:hypothetical protein Agub_g11816, partial [Astrephomene gubernaculifera]
MERSSAYRSSSKWLRRMTPSRTSYGLRAGYVPLPRRIAATATGSKNGNKGPVIVMRTLGPGMPGPDAKPAGSHTSSSGSSGSVWDSKDRSAVNGNGFNGNTNSSNGNLSYTPSSVSSIDD